MVAFAYTLSRDILSRRIRTWRHSKEAVWRVVEVVVGWRFSMRRRRIEPRSRITEGGKEVRVESRRVSTANSKDVESCFRPRLGATEKRAAERITNE